MMKEDIIKVKDKLNIDDKYPNNKYGKIGKIYANMDFNNPWKSYENSVYINGGIRLSDGANFGYDKIRELKSEKIFLKEALQLKRNYINYVKKITNNKYNIRISYNTRYSKNLTDDCFENGGSISRTILDMFNFKILFFKK